MASFLPLRQTIEELQVTVMDFSALFIKMVIFAVLLITGYLAARKGFLTPDFSKSASWLLVNVFLVASIINSVLGTRPELPQKELWSTLLVIFLMMALLYVISALCMRFDPEPDVAPQTLILMTAVNNLFVGMPIVQTLAGSEAVFYMGLSCIPYNLFLYSYGVWQLKKGRGKKGIRVKDIISASLIAALLSLVIFVLDRPMPRLVTDLFGTVASATVPVSMLVIGATLGRVRLGDAFSKKKFYVLSLIRLVVTPVLVFFLFRPFVTNPVLLLAIVVTAACPSGAINTPLSIQYGYDPTYSSEVIMVTTALSMITLPLLLFVLF